MKTLENIQKQNRKMILETIQGCSYEEALEKELGFGCKVIDIKHQFFGEYSPEEMVFVEDTGDQSFYFKHYRGNPLVETSRQSILDKNRYEILGKPLTLDRVLLALFKRFKEEPIQPEIINNFPIINFTFHAFVNDIGTTLELSWDWDFRKPTLEEQKEETQRAIHKLWGGEND